MKYKVSYFVIPKNDPFIEGVSYNRTSQIIEAENDFKAIEIAETTFGDKVISITKVVTVYSQKKHGLMSSLNFTKGHYGSFEIDEVRTAYGTTINR